MSERKREEGASRSRQLAAVSGPRKAAILLMAVGETLAKELLRALPEVDVQRLTEELADLRGITPEISTEVLEEFWQLMATQDFVIHGGLDYTSRLLTDTFGKERADDFLLLVRRSQEASQGNLAKLQRTDPQQLGKLLDAEHPQTIALVLAHLDPKRASLVLNNLSEEHKVVAIQRLAEMHQFRLPLEREPIRLPLSTGVRVIDGFLTVGRGQRIGIFGGSGVGKSTLIGMMTRNTGADITIVGLVGERGREVGEFLEHALGEAGRARSVVVVSTSDQSPLMRMRAALSAVTLAEYFASEGKHVLLVLDSLTRFAMAAREIGLAAGEPPTAKGYTPSVFTRLAKLLERAGNFHSGSITGFYTVLMEGDDQQDPLVDTVRSLLDGHIVLSRAQAAEGWYPPIAILDSVSRLMPAVTDPSHRKHVELLRRLMAVHARSEDLIRIGAYKPGSDPDLDRALRAHEAIRSFLIQGADEYIPANECLKRLEELAKEV